MILFFRLLRVLLFCSVRVAHLQFSLEYPASLLMRSMLCPSGLGPMSSKKF
jgi:hypothetical protein